MFAKPPPPRCPSAAAAISTGCVHRNGPNQKLGCDPTGRISYSLSFYSSQEHDKGVVEYTLKTGPEELIVLGSDPV